MDKLYRPTDVVFNESSRLAGKSTSKPEFKKYGEDIPSIVDILEKRRKTITFNTSYQAEQRSQVKEVTAAQLQKAVLTQKMDLAEEKMARVQEFLELLQRLQKSDDAEKESTQKIQEFIHKFKDFQKIAEESEEAIARLNQNNEPLPKEDKPASIQKTEVKTEPKPYKTDYSSSYDPDYLKFANVLNDLSPKPSKKASKSFEALKARIEATEARQPHFTESKPMPEQEKDHKEVSQTTQALREDVRRKTLEQSPESLREEERLKNAVEQKQQRHAIDLKQKAQINEKKEAETAGLERVQTEIVREQENRADYLAKKRVELLEIVPLMDEKKILFEIVYGEKAQALKQRLEEALKAALSDRDDERYYRIREEEEQKQEEQEALPYVGTAEVIPTNLLIQVAGDTPQLSLRSQIVSEISQGEALFQKIEGKFQSQVVRIAQSLNSRSRQDIPSDSVEAIIMEFLHDIEEIQQQMSQARQELGKKEEIKEKILNETDFRPLLGVREAETIAEKLIQPAGLPQIQEVQRKMTPWAVSQLLY